MAQGDERMPGRVFIDGRNANEKNRKQLALRGFSFGLGAVFHPLQCVKVLIQVRKLHLPTLKIVDHIYLLFTYQLGHEPIPLKHSKGIFSSRYEYWLPNGISYGNNFVY